MVYLSGATSNAGVYPELYPTSHDIQPGDAQLLLYAGLEAPIGLVDLQFYVGPDSVPGDEVMDTLEYLDALTRFAEHLTRYIRDFRGALEAEGCSRERHFDD